MATSTGRNPLVVAATIAVVAVLGLAAWFVLHRPTRRAQTPSTVPLTVGAQPVAPAQVPAAWARARAQVAQVMKTKPEQLSPYGKVEPFNEASFAHDPQSYLDKIEPARCFQVAKPGPGVPVLDVASPLRTQAVRGEPVILWAKTTPNAPVTFTTFGGGYFKENGIVSVSVQADARGLAGAHYVAEQGISGDVTVVAGSPVTSGSQSFLIHVLSSPPGRTP